MSQIKVSDTVGWMDVPDGALTRHADSDGDTVYCVRVDGQGWFTNVSDAPDTWVKGGRGWPWHIGKFDPVDGVVTIIVLGLTGQETAAELQRLAEVYEVREALRADDYLWCVTHELLSRRGAATSDENMAHELHAAGWRPGMTAEDAARLLAPTQAREPICSVCHQDFTWNEDADRTDEGPLFCNACAQSAVVADGAARPLAEVQS